MNYRNLNNNNHSDSDSDDDYRPPIASKVQNLTYGNFESFEEYKKKINENDEYDEDMKQALIETRMDFLMENMPELLVDSNNSNNKVNTNINNDEYMDRVIKLAEVANKINEIIELNNNVGTKLKNKINDYINLQTDLITFDNESFLDIEQIFDKIKLDPSILTNVFDIIVPENKEAFHEYKQIVEQSKKDYQILQEKIRLEQELIRLEQEKIILQKEKEQNEIKIEKERRIGITNILMSKIVKISGFDNEARELKEILTPLFEDYNNLVIHYINLDPNDLDKVNNFIKKTRFTDQDKYNIYKIFI
jgi:hypothetical protein